MKDFEWVKLSQERPESDHWYDVLRINFITKFLYETLARWNGQDWFSVSERKISNEIKYWKKKGK